MQSISCESTKKLSAFISDTNYGNIPEEVILRVKMCIMDWIGSAYSGIGSSTDTIMHNLIKEMGGMNIATLIGSEYSAPPMWAALYNGMISGVMEIDDVHEEVQLHPSIAIIPAALAVAEYTGSSGRDLMTSIIIGYDISVRIARCAGTTHYRLWHSTGTCNTFGAAAAAGKLLNMDEKGLTMALGLSGTQASGLWESINAEATMAKHLHGGKASFNGIFSAFLAKAGYKGSDRIIEGKKGFLAVFSKATKQDIIKLTEAFGKPFLITKNFFKKYACCRGCFEGIEGVHNILTQNNLNPKDIEKILVTTTPTRVWTVGNKKPKNIYEAKFSLPFCLALIANNKNAGLYDFNEENLNHPLIKEFMRKVKLVSDPHMPLRVQRIEVICRDKSIFSQELLCKSLNMEEVKEKFIKNMLPISNEEYISNILCQVENLEKIENVKELTNILKHKPRRSF